MQNEDGQIITQTNRHLVGRYASRELIDKLKTRTENHFVQKDGKSRSFVSWREIGNTGWILIKISDYDLKLRELSAIKRETFIFIVVILLVFIMVTTLISYSITAPIKKLKRLIKRVEQGDFEANSSFYGNDEIAELGRSFNQMVLKINELITKIKDEQRLKEELQLELMQAQINPHFIFNTLNTIKWTAMINQATNTAQLIEDFGRIIGTSIKEMDKLITVREEIANVRSYLNIQKARFNYPLSDNIKIPENIAQCKIPKLILQPLVENSITHGYGNQYEKRITLTITAYQSEQHLIFEIEDDGCGISPEKLNQIVREIEEKSNARRTNGIGIYNVHKRIQLMFGEEFGLKIDIRINDGTTIKLILPFIPEEEAHDPSDDC
ncbi:MAG TPA: sensor histidine kinase [Bacillota bacterium]|nr:sensor histidine kinase [Bacillota bacterium]